MQARPLYIKFSRTLRSTLFRRLWAANSLDLILDFVLTYVSVVFNYASPFFLKRILDSLDPRSNPTPEKRALAYIYAVLAFLSTLCKAQADVQHLWFGRRAATRIRSELMAAIYDKALKRKDFSGLVDKDPKNAEVKASSKGDDPKAGADIGKIVNLMAGDANRISQVVTGSYFIYGAPFEIVIAATFLYQLLGLSAFAGFIVLIVGWPLNSIVSKRAVRIHKGVSSARDKRMGVLNELIGAMKFIKFFAWEEQWINRAMDAREVEMKWMVKARLNSVMFSLIWICAPILVSVTSFFVYVVQGNELTVGTAFTVSTFSPGTQGKADRVPGYRSVQHGSVSEVCAMESRLLINCKYQRPVERHPCLDCPDPPGRCRHGPYLNLSRRGGSRRASLHAQEGPRAALRRRRQGPRDPQRLVQVERDRREEGRQGEGQGERYERTQVLVVVA